MKDQTGARRPAPLLLWRDYLGAVHACERTDIRQAFYVFSTLCGRNVPPNAHWPSEPRAINCPECARQAADYPARARFPPSGSSREESDREHKETRL
jgi:hypothetical protein